MWMCTEAHYTPCEPQLVGSPVRKPKTAALVGPGARCSSWVPANVQAMHRQAHAPSARAAPATVAVPNKLFHSTRPPLLEQASAHLKVSSRSTTWRCAATKRQGAQRSTGASSFTAPSPGVPLRAGLRQVGGNPDCLQGWRVCLDGGQGVGTVTKVLHIKSDGGAATMHLLQVERPATLEPYGHEGREVHHIPLVADIVPTLDIASRAVYITPPEGLLEIGRRQLVLSFLKTELQQYAPTVAPQQTEGAAPLELQRWMPTRQQLEDAGRRDLVLLITGVASFSEVALLLGMRSKRRPNGYWEAIENLDRELSSFIAASWVQLPHPDSPDDMYYYNVATRRASWTAPKRLPGSVLDDDDDDGFSTRQERAADRVLPSRNTIQGAGRWDLHHAIYYHGGYKATAEQLKRRPVWPIAPAITGPRQLRQHLQKAAAELGLPEGHMPSMTALRDLDRGDAAQAVTRMGGVGAVSHQLKLRGARGKMLTLPQLAEELQCFMVNPAPTPTAGSPTSKSSAKAAPSKLPTHRQLHQANRCDLLHALQVHGHARVAEYMGLQPRTRGAVKGVLTWEAVEAALLAGCTSAQQIAAHLNGQQRAGQGLSPATMHIKGMVTKIWLHRRLSQWVAEGRVKRVRRGVYELPQHDHTPGMVT